MHLLCIRPPALTSCWSAEALTPSLLFSSSLVLCCVVLCSGEEADERGGRAQGSHRALPRSAAGRKFVCVFSVSDKSVFCFFFFSFFGWVYLASNCNNFLFQSIDSSSSRAGDETAVLKQEKKNSCQPNFFFSSWGGKKEREIQISFTPQPFSDSRIELHIQAEQIIYSIFFFFFSPSRCCC